MDNDNTYVSILKNTIIRKYNVLADFLKLMDEFEKYMEANNDKIDAKYFEEFLSSREAMIKQINSLDEGFENVYEKVQRVIKEDPTPYREDIKIMQQYIPKITDLGVKLDVTEKRNRVRIENIFRKRKSEVKTFKMSQKTVSNYYKNAYSGYQTSEYRKIDKKK